MRQAMKLKYIYTLLTLIIALYFVPANAQTKQKGKKTTTKAVKKTPAKPAPKPAAKKPAKPTTAQQKNANSLGDAVAKAAANTTKKGGNPNGIAEGNLSQEIIVTTAYKPVL